MKVRLIGTPDQVAAAVEALTEVAELAEVSRPYPCRGDRTRVRVYLALTTR